MLQSEAVVALKGSDCEHKLIRLRYDEFKRRTSVLFVAYWKFGQVRSKGSHSFTWLRARTNASRARQDTAPRGQEGHLSTSRAARFLESRECQICCQVNQFLMNYLLDNFTSVFVIAPGKTRPLPCVSAAFVSHALPFLADFQGFGTRSTPRSRRSSRVKTDRNLCYEPQHWLECFSFSEDS